MEYAGRYFDGTSLEATPVRVRLGGGRLVVESTDGRELSAHAGSDVLLLYVDQRGNRIDLGIRHEGDVRLMLEGPGIRDSVARDLPQVSGPVRGEGFAAAVKVSGFLVAMLLVIGLAYWQLEKLVPNLISDDMADSLGRELSDTFTEGFGGVCEAPEGQAALDRLVARLAATSGHQGRFTVQVARNDMVNAFALPGGHLVIFEGLLEKAAGPDEVAGVLAHEMGHEIHKHSLRGLTRAFGFQLIATLFTGSDVSHFSQQMIMLAYSRSMEEEADAAALELLRAAGIASEPLAGFFDKVAAEEGSGRFSGIASFLSSHPDSRARAAAIRAQQDTATGPALEGQDWQALRSICETREARKADERT